MTPDIEDSSGPGPVTELINKIEVQLVPIVAAPDLFPLLNDEVKCEQMFAALEKTFPECDYSTNGRVLVISPQTIRMTPLIVSVESAVDAIEHGYDIPSPSYWIGRRLTHESRTWVRKRALGNADIPNKRTDSVSKRKLRRDRAKGRV